MQKDRLRLAIIALEENEREFYEDLLSGYSDLIPESFSTIPQFKVECTGKDYSGIVVDNRTLIRSTMEDRDFFSQLCEGFPVMRISRSSDRTSISCLVEGKQLVDLKGRQLLDHFINRECREVIAHQVRISQRKKVFFNTYLQTSGSDEPLRTNLWDISEGGCFVITTDNQRKEGEEVTITIHDLNDKTPIQGEIKWLKSWGSDAHKLPGYGLEFKEISDSQVQEIKRAHGMTF